MRIVKGIAPEHICRLLANSSGMVEMVNSRGIYLCLSGIRVLLCDRETGTVPNGVALENFQKLTGFLQVGQEVTCINGLLKAASCAFCLQLQVAGQDVQSCAPSRDSLENAAELLKKRKATTGLALLVLGKPVNNPYCTLAKPFLEGLMEAVAADNLPEIEKNTQALLGLGPGLTPSGDDVLSGIVYGLRHSPLREKLGVITLCDCVKKLAAQTTNAVSADYLCAIAEDAAFDIMANTWREPERYAEELLKVGSNSGSEMLLGLLLAGKLLEQLS